MNIGATKNGRDAVFLHVPNWKEIQSAAMQLFVQKGYGSTNVQDIADTAGISIGLLYRHYKSKETLFDEQLS